MGGADDMRNLWKTHPQPAVMQILTADMPAKITHLRGLLDGEADEASTLWTGAVHTGAYVDVGLEPAGEAGEAGTAGTAGTAGEAGKAGKVGAAIDGGGGDAASDGDAVANKDGATGKDSPAVGFEHENGDHGEHDGHEDHGGHGDGRRWTDRLPVNANQAELGRLVIQEQEDLHIMVTDLRLWLELEVPVIEDGNSFGAEVQAHMARHLEEAQKLTRGMFGNMRSHHLDRVRCATDWLKHPGLDDLAHAVRLSDRFDHLLARTHLRLALQLYGAVMCKFERNWEKIIRPKGSGGGSGAMY